MNEWKDCPDSAGLWAAKCELADDPTGEIVALDAELRDPDGYIWSEVFAPGCRFYKLPPDTPPLRPGLTQDA